MAILCLHSYSDHSDQITDAPQILSGDTLAILDPHHNLSESGGLKLDVASSIETCADHFTAFNLDSIAPNYTVGDYFPGTIIRLPLRIDPSSKISPKVVNPQEIKTLLVDFVQGEMDIAMLFLSHISRIEILEIDESGKHIVGHADIHRTPPTMLDAQHTISVSTITAQHEIQATSVDWNILHAKYAQQECNNILADKLGAQTSALLEKEKLSPSISLAIRAQIPKANDGRLFTFLPLPLPTGFPCHVHALFALTQARQNLRNGSERGMVKGTTDECVCSRNYREYKH